ncbi:unnamed protein product, partial [Laminaria digitata]
RDAALPSRLAAASTLLVDTARPYLPDRAAPALHMADQNPIAFLATLLAGIMAVLMLTMRKKKGKPLRSSTATTAPARSAVVDASSSKEEVVAKEEE